MKWRERSYRWLPATEVDVQALRTLNLEPAMERYPQLFVTELVNGLSQLAPEDGVLQERIRSTFVGMLTRLAQRLNTDCPVIPRYDALPVEFAEKYIALPPCRVLAGKALHGLNSWAAAHSRCAGLP